MSVFDHATNPAVENGLRALEAAGLIADGKTHSLAGGAEALNITSGQELFERKYEPRRFLIDGLICAGDLVILAGRPKSGKSWLLLQLAQAIDGGGSWLGRAATAGRVLYIALEDGERRLYERLHIRRWKPKRAAFAFAMLSLSEGGLGQIEDVAPEYDCIIIDTLRAAAGGSVDENDNARMGELVQGVANIAHTTGCTILIVHHTRKGEAEDAFDLIRGAGAIRGAYDVGIVIERKPKEREALLRFESRDIEAEDMTIQFDGAHGWKYEGDGARIEEIRAGRAVVQALRAMGEGWYRVEDIAHHMQRDRSSVARQLASAERQGVVVRKSEQVRGKSKPADLWGLAEWGT